MKCVKCGFVSFDYISECKKCGTSLAAAREGLGFSAVKPVSPSLLGSLLRDTEPQQADLEPGAAGGPALSFEMGEGFGGGFRPVEDAPEAASATILNPEEGEEDFSLLDLSDEELELLIEKKPGIDAQDGRDFWLELDADKIDITPVSPAPETFEAGQRQTLSPETAKEGGTAEVESLPEFDLGPLPELSAADLEALELEPHADPLVAAPVEKPKDAPRELEDEFVIELSENDLESLLGELDKTRKEEGEEKGPDAPDDSRK